MGCNDSGTTACYSDDNSYSCLDVIEQYESEKLLVVWIHQNMKWGEHVFNNDES